MDTKELEIWLNTRPRQDAILIAQRAALRVFPQWGGRAPYFNKWSRPELTLAPILRSILSFGVARRFPCEESEAACRSAVSTALAEINRISARDSTQMACPGLAATEASAASVGLAAYGLGYAHTRGVAFWAIVAADVDLLSQRGDLETLPLWPDGLPDCLEHLELDEREAKDVMTLEFDDEDSFWHRWYFAAKQGQWLNWHLQREVALIPDAIWDKGPAAVMAEIKKIETRFAA